MSDSGRKTLIIAVACMLVAGLALGAWCVLPEDGDKQSAARDSPKPSASVDPHEDKSNDELVDAALSAEEPASGKRAAVVRLTERTTLDEHNPTREQLRQVFRDSSEPIVRAAAIKGIARGWDYDVMDELLDALDDESAAVRESAGLAVEKMIGLRFHYRASDPPEERAKKVALMRSTWAKFKSTGTLDEWLARLSNDESLEHLRPK